jgi:hypothetical protein
MKRRGSSSALVLVGVLVMAAAGTLWLTSTVNAEEEATMTTSTTVSETYGELFKLSMEGKKSVTLYVDGQQIAGVVTGLIGDEGVELRNREYSRIAVRIERIDAVALY